MYEFRLKQNC